MIKPSIGRVVWFYPDAGFSNTNTPSSNGEPLPALITRVWGDALINIGGFDANGKPFARTSVTLLGADDTAPDGMHATWMPFQLQQAKAQDVQTPAPFLVALPTLTDDERYAGLILDSDGAPTHHLILLPGAAEDVTWPDALAWAEQAGGTLPTCQEQALLYANLKAEFTANWYWSSEQYAGGEAYAWCQHFLLGSQCSHHKFNELRARAVRRLPI